MPDIRVNGIRLAYDDTGGRGPAVMFSHGLLASRHMFAPQIAALRDTHRCVAWDHRGQGDSEVPSGRSCTMDDCAEDAAALIAALGLGPVHFVGLSMGGFVGIRLAARRPALIRSLTLLDTAADPEPTSNIPRYRRMLAFARVFGVRAPLADRVMPILFGRSFLNDPHRSLLRAQWRARLMGNRRSVAKAVRGVLERPGVEEALSAVRCPTLVLHGDEDTAIAEPRARALAAGIAGARFVSIPRAGHTCTIENPAAVNAALVSFLEDCP